MDLTGLARLRVRKSGEDDVGSEVGLLVSTTAKVAVPPRPEKERPVAGVTATPATSASVLVTVTAGMGTPA